MESILGLESIDKQLRRWWEGRENNSLGSVWSFFPFDPVCPNISLFLSTRFCSFLVNCRSLCSVLCFLDVFFICVLDRGLGLLDNCWGPSFSYMWRSEIFWWSSLHLFRLLNDDVVPLWFWSSCGTSHFICSLCWRESYTPGRLLFNFLFVASISWFDSSSLVCLGVAFNPGHTLTSSVASFWVVGLWVLLGVARRWICGSIQFYVVEFISS